MRGCEQRCRARKFVVEIKGPGAFAWEVEPLVGQEGAFAILFSFVVIIGIATIQHHSLSGRVSRRKSHHDFHPQASRRTTGRLHPHY